MCFQRSDEARKEKKARNRDKDEQPERAPKVVSTLKESSDSNSASPSLKPKRERSRSPIAAKRCRSLVVAIPLLY